MLWQGSHPIAPGAQVDFVADESYEVTPSRRDLRWLNKVASDGYGALGRQHAPKRIRKNFVPFGLKAGTNFMEYDLVYLRGDMLFWGARNIDGRGFDTEQNRPTNLQIPLIRSNRGLRSDLIPEQVVHGWFRKSFTARQTAVGHGATGGLGYETALALAKAGAEVILTGRDDQKGQSAIEKIDREVIGAKLSYEHLDLCAISHRRRPRSTHARPTVP